MFLLVLNLIITGIPSIRGVCYAIYKSVKSFKPYYNWNTFNTMEKKDFSILLDSFKPYYNWNTFNTLDLNQVEKYLCIVLNLIITGIPSILLLLWMVLKKWLGFKPYYNWNTFNTLDLNKNIDFMVDWFTF